MLKCRFLQQLSLTAETLNPPSSLVCTVLFNSKDVNLENHRLKRISGAYLWAAGQEGLNVDVGVMHFEIVVPKTSCDPDGCQHTSLQKMQHNLHLN